MANKSDSVILSLGLTQSKQLPSLFYKYEGDVAELVDENFVNDLKATEFEQNTKNFLKQFNLKVKLWTVNNGPGNSIFRTNVIQKHDLTIATNAEDKLDAIAKHLNSRLRRKEAKLPKNMIKNLWTVRCDRLELHHLRFPCLLSIYNRKPLIW